MNVTFEAVLQPLVGVDKKELQKYLTDSYTYDFYNFCVKLVIQTQVRRYNSIVLYCVRLAKKSPQDCHKKQQQQQQQQQKPIVLDISALNAMW